MSELSPEAQLLKDLLATKAKLAGMLAPSFPVVYQYPQIVGRLKRLGFSYVVEVALGAVRTNEAVIAALKNDPESRFITGPCPSLVRMVKDKYPDLVGYLAQAVDSPMVASAKIVQELYPGFKPVFIGPCVAKKFEAKEDHPELDILVVTYKELEDIFESLSIQAQPEDELAAFDQAAAITRLYPISGGLAQSSEVRDLIADDEIEVVSGWENCQQALERFAQGKTRLLDILFCDGGCINGPGTFGELDTAARRERVVEYWKKSA